MIRKATPDDVEDIVKGIYDAGHDFLPWLFGKDHHAIIRELAISEKSSFSWTNCFVYEIGGSVAGIIISYPSKLESEMDKGTHTIFRRYMSFFELWKFIRRARKAVKYFVKPKNSYYILALAVFENHRGKGIAGKLMHYVEEIARKRNYTSLALEVENYNHSAIRSYQKFGFLKYDEVALSKFSKQFRSRKNAGMLLLRKKIG
ncbi:MAG: GNAT family N-acetyltransferase [Candidatus Woesearchaeota archaeon]